MSVTLTAEQQRAHDYIIDWVKSRRNGLLTLGGLAGVGKTTLLGEVASTLKRGAKRVAFCTVSGKASTVLKSKMKEHISPEDYCGTIHGLIYILVGKKELRNGRTELYFQESGGTLAASYDLIIIDEASMVNEWMFNDLASHGVPILAVGDHGQLPPVKGSFNLMEDPDIKLETIMRQAEGNPIIKMAHMARAEGVIKYGDYGAGCFKTRDTRVLHDHRYNDLDNIMLCAINKTRVRMNTFAREKLAIASPKPVPGEPIICLYNNRTKKIYNGNIGVLTHIQDDPLGDSYYVNVDMGDFFYDGEIEPQQFGREYTKVDEESDNDYFDWAYCITTHKSQGSEWKNVLIVEEGEWMFKGDLWRRWLYTAATRAKERLIIYKR